MILVKGAKNSSENNTGEDPTDNGNTSGDYNIYAMICTGFDAHGNARFFQNTAIVWVYSNKFDPSKPLPTVFYGTVPNFPQNFYGDAVYGNPRRWTFNYSSLYTWYVNYGELYKYNIKKLVEAKFKYIKFPDLHNGDGNAVLHVTINHLHSGDYQSITRHIIRFNSDVTFWRQDDARNNDNPPYDKRLIELVITDINVPPQESVLKNFF